jgi:hypothetical protein
MPPGDVNSPPLRLGGFPPVLFLAVFFIAEGPPTDLRPPPSEGRAMVLAMSGGEVGRKVGSV